MAGSENASRKRFEDVYASIRDQLLQKFKEHSMPEEVIDYYRRVWLTFFI
jgi:hypothetical protein